MSIQAINWAIETRVGDPVLKILLMTLANYANTEDQTWHRQERIAFDTEISVRTLRRRLSELVDLGLITVEDRRRDDGGKDTSMITLVRHPPANLAGTPSGQKEGSPSATKVAGHITVKNRKEEYTYSAEFEALWEQYPRTKNTSKKKAWDLYRMLNDENQSRVRTALPLFAAAMRAEGRPEDKIMHMTTWLNGRTYETASAPGPKAVGAPDRPFWETATRKDWSSALLIWSSNWVWKKIWGPEPGQPGCHVPPDILDRFDVKYRGHLYSTDDYEALKARVERAKARVEAAE